jgi:predicted RNA binding protein YcfA (HicA-like mRNA interferase family)
MKTPRDLSWWDVVKALSRFGYTIVRQKGSHPIRVGALEAIVAKAAMHFKKTKSEMMEDLFGNPSKRRQGARGDLSGQQVRRLERQAGPARVPHSLLRPLVVGGSCGEAHLPGS